MEIKSKNTVLSLNQGEARCSIQQFYDKIAALLGYDSEAVAYDSSKICCTPDIQEEIMSYYRKHGYTAQVIEWMWDKFGPKGCLCEGVRIVMVEDGFVNVVCEIKTQLTEKMNQFFGMSNSKEFISSHFGEALEVYINKGVMLDLDSIVHLEDLLGFNVSYELFKFMNIKYEEDSLLYLDESDYGDLMFLCKQFSE